MRPLNSKLATCLWIPLLFVCSAVATGMLAFPALAGGEVDSRSMALHFRDMSNSIAPTGGCCPNLFEFVMWAYGLLYILIGGIACLKWLRRGKENAGHVALRHGGKVLLTAGCILLAMPFILTVNVLGSIGFPEAVGWVFISLLIVTMPALPWVILLLLEKYRRFRKYTLAGLLLFYAAPALALAGFILKLLKVF